MASLVWDELPLYDASGKSSPPDYEFSPINPVFPVQFNIYRKVGLVYPTTATLAVDESLPLYHIALDIGLLDPNSPNVVLHCGVSEQSSIVASSQMTRSGCGFRIQMAGFGSIRLENMELYSRKLSRKYTFFDECDGSDGIRRQTFEWRPSRGEDVRGLGLRCFGWKLVWVKDESQGDEEVVAVWSRCSDAASKKILGFRFLRSGIPGHFSKKWKLMVVITALALWQTEIMNH